MPRNDAILDRYWIGGNIVRTKSKHGWWCSSKLCVWKWRAWGYLPMPLLSFHPSLPFRYPNWSILFATRRRLAPLLLLWPSQTRRFPDLASLNRAYNFNDSWLSWLLLFATLFSSVTCAVYRGKTMSAVLLFIPERKFQLTNLSRESIFKFFDFLPSYARLSPS